MNNARIGIARSVLAVTLAATIMKRQTLPAMVLCLVLSLLTIDTARADSGACAYQRAVSLDVPTAVDDYQVRVDLTTDNFNYAHAHAAGNDLRFEETNTLQSLHYWIQAWDTGGTSTVWVSVPNAGTTGFTMYYGNATAPAASSGTNTFDFFDDFNAGNAANWIARTSNGVVTLTGGYIEIGGGTTSGPGYGHTAMASRYYSGFGDGILEGSIYLSDQAIAEVGFRGTPPNSGYKSRMDARPASNDSGGICHHKPPYSGWQQFGEKTSTSVGKLDWKPFKITVNGSSMTIAIESQSLTSTDTQYAGPGEISLQNHYGHYARYDDIRVRKYAATEPTATVGAEHSSSGTPGIVNLAPSNVVSGAAFLNGTIVSAGSAPVTDVAVYWGATDGGTNASLWANTNVFAGGPWAQSDLLSTNVTTLPVGQDCFYTYYAENANGGAWAVPSKYFTQGELTLSTTDNACGSSPTDTATVVVSRPSNCTGGVLIVYYTTSGEATNGVNYTASPASGSVVLLAGQTDATITITPKAPWNSGAPKTFSLALASGLYMVGDSNTIACTLATIPVTTYTWNGSSAEWNDSSRWFSPDLGNGLPNNGSTGIVASGEARVTTDANSDLYNAGVGETAPAEIRIQTNATLRLTTHWPNNHSLNLDHNLVLDGGTFAADNADNNNFHYDFGIRIRSGSTIAAELWYPEIRYGKFYLNGLLSDYDAAHTGPITKTGTGLLHLTAPNAPFTGGWSIQQGEVWAEVPGALGTGLVAVTNNGVLYVNPPGGDMNLPSITVDAGGIFRVHRSGDAHFSTAPGQKLTIHDGGTVGFDADYTTMYFDMPIHVSGNVVLSSYCLHTSSSLYWTGDIINQTPASITLAGNEWGRFTKAGNAYTGNWIVASRAEARADGAMGMGGFLEVRSNCTFRISQSLTLRNMIAGEFATIDASGKTLTLQPWYTNATLYAAGISPGANWGSAIGSLAVSGNLAFTNRVDYDGLGSTAYCRLAVDVGGPADTPASDVVTATGNILGLDNVDLYVSLTNTTSSALNGRTFVFLSGANAQDPKSFHKVVPPPGTTIVVTTNGLPTGSLGLLFRSTGTMLMIR